MSIVSFLNDIASEMVYPIIPIFLTSVLGAPVSVVGLIEGIAESAASLLKVVFGRWSDKVQKRKPFVVYGYGLSSLAKLILAAAVSWPLVLLSKIVDKIGKGTRTSARDALLAENSAPENRGKVFGFHRAADTAGAIVGPLIAVLVLYHTNNFRPIFILSFITPLIGVLLLIIYITEKKKEPKVLTPLRLSISNLNSKFKFFLAASIIFSLGNSADAFLILRAQNLGLTVVLAVLAYVTYNISYALFSVPAGIISDKLGAKKVLITGLLIFTLVYLLFGITHNKGIIWLLFPLYGLYMALSDGVGKAYISNLVDQEHLGTAYGVYQTAIGLCAFFASLIAGLLWSKVSVSAPFIFGSTMSFIAAVFLMLRKDSTLVIINKGSSQQS